MRTYDCGGRRYFCDDRCCLFCSHCTDVFYDYTNGIYLLFCNIEKDTERGWEGKCDFFEEDEEVVE